MSKQDAMTGWQILPGEATTGREASEWFAALQATQDLSPEVLQAWLRWLEASEENRQAFQDIAQIWHGTNASVVAQPSNAPEEEDYDDSISVAQWRANKRSALTNLEAPLTSESAEGQSAVSVPKVMSRKEARWRRPLMAAAAAALIGVSTIIGIKGIDVLSPAISEGHFATRRGEHLELLLADGSHVTLGAQSRLAVHFKPAVREVRLDSGEAFFSVREDPSRPFNVLALDGVITAVGTAFNVRAIEDRVTVTVTEGAVRVAEDAAAAHAGGNDPKAPHAGTDKTDTTRRVARGQELVYRSANASLSPMPVVIKYVDPAESVRWRSGWLMYHNEPLRYVIADVGRYTDLKLAVNGAAADLKFSGAIYKDRIAEWIVALPEVSPVTLEKETDRLTIKLRERTTVVHH